MSGRVCVLTHTVINTLCLERNTLYCLGDQNRWKCVLASRVPDKLSRVPKLSLFLVSLFSLVLWFSLFSNSPILPGPSTSLPPGGTTWWSAAVTSLYYEMRPVETLRRLEGKQCLLSMCMSGGALWRWLPFHVAIAAPSKWYRRHSNH